MHKIKALRLATTIMIKNRQLTYLQAFESGPTHAKVGDYVDEIFWVPADQVYVIRPEKGELPVIVHTSNVQYSITLGLLKDDEQQSPTLRSAARTKKETV